MDLLEFGIGVDVSRAILCWNDRFSGFPRVNLVISVCVCREWEGEEGQSWERVQLPDSLKLAFSLLLLPADSSVTSLMEAVWRVGGITSNTIFNTNERNEQNSPLWDATYVKADMKIVDSRSICSIHTIPRIVKITARFGPRLKGISLSSLMSKTIENFMFSCFSDETVIISNESLKKKLCAPCNCVWE